jgi:hypothetical protein
MWNSFEQDIPIYVNNDLIKVFGYKGLINDQKRHILNLVKKYNISVIQLKNEEYEEFTHDVRSMPNNSPNHENTQYLPIENLYPKITTEQLKSKPLHTLIMPKDLKKLWLVVNTSNGDKIRDYVIALDDLFNLYLEYQSKYKSQQLTIKDKKIDELLYEVRDMNNTLREMKQEQEVQTEVLDEVVDKLDRATDERAPRTRSASKQGQFLLIELNSPVSPWQYYVIRAQKGSIKQTYTKLLEKFPNCAIKLKINYQPNAVNLFNLIKEELRNVRKVIRVSSNYIKLASDYTKEQFIEDVKKINAEKKDV